VENVQDVEPATQSWVHWHNTARLHGYLRDMPPAEYETAFYPDHRPGPGRNPMARVSIRPRAIHWSLPTWDAETGVPRPTDRVRSYRRNSSPGLSGGTHEFAKTCGMTWAGHGRQVRPARQAAMTGQPVEPSEAFDVFISYRHGGPCALWVTDVLTRRLRDAGLAVCLDVDSFRPGSVLVLDMEHAVVRSRYTLAVLSPAYLESAFTQLETELAQHLGLETTQQRLLIVRREPCEPRLGLRARVWLDMRDDEETDRNMERLVAAIRMPAAG
jgi:TIR domain